MRFTLAPKPDDFPANVLGECWKFVVATSFQCRKADTWANASRALEVRREIPSPDRNNAV